MTEQEVQLARPWQITVGLPLMAPAAVAWALAGMGLFWKNADDGLLPLILFALPLGLALLALGVFGLRGIVRAWRRERIGTGTWLSNALMVGAVVVMAMAWVRSHSAGRRTGTVNVLEWEPTMIVPILLGAVAAIALFLLTRPVAKEWFPPPPERPTP
jgi:hypothetical protein